ncbi:hypothetical protein FOA52_003274 [Chlamydomonas sp. UWO 241]|nr:hypothetical protein FOA52_003274 [Chlamydomonas sp. UWO 241]
MLAARAHTHTHTLPASRSANDNKAQQQKKSLGVLALFTNVQPRSSLGAPASSQASTEEGRLLEKKMDESAVAGDTAQKKPPVLLLLVRALGRAFTHCLKPSGVRF